MREGHLPTRVGFVLKYCSKHCFLESVFAQELEKTGFRVVRGRQVGEKVLSWCHASTFFNKSQKVEQCLFCECIVAWNCFCEYIVAPDSHFF